MKRTCENTCRLSSGTKKEKNNNNEKINDACIAPIETIFNKLFQRAIETVAYLNLYFSFILFLAALRLIPFIGSNLIAAIWVL